MAQNKIRLPAGTPSASTENVADALQRERLKLEQVRIEGQAKVQVQALQVLGEFLAVVKAGIDLFKEDKKLKATRAEWQGRITVSEAEIAKARLELERARTQAEVRHAELDFLKPAQEHMLNLFDELMRTLPSADVDSQQRTLVTQQLLELSVLLVRQKA